MSKLLYSAVFLLFGLTPVAHGADVKGVDQLDEADRQEFNAHLLKATGCSKSANFACSANELAKARKFANSAADYAALKAAAENIELSRQLSVRDEAQRKYSSERSAVEVQAVEAEEELAQNRRAAAASGQRAERALLENQRSKDNADKQSARDYKAAIAGQIQQRSNENSALLKRMDSQMQAAVNESNRVLAAQASERARVRAEREESETVRRADATRDRQSKQQANTARLEEEQRAQRHRADEAAAAKERSQLAMAEQEQKRRKLADQQQARLEKADEERRRIAAANAEKAAAQRAEAEYFTSMRQGIRLVATKCPDNAGHYYATGILPKVKSKVDLCIDVSYEASCPGDRNVVTGVAKNFIGMSGCFGDTYQIDPKPECSVKEVRIRVTDVLPGCK